MTGFLGSSAGSGWPCTAFSLPLATDAGCHPIPFLRVVSRSHGGTALSHKERMLWFFLEPGWKERQHLGTNLQLPKKVPGRAHRRFMGGTLLTWPVDVPIKGITLHFLQESILCHLYLEILFSRSPITKSLLEISYLSLVTNPQC